MNEAVDFKGTTMIVLTKEEYQELVEDAADIVLTAEARRKEGPTMSGEYMLPSLDGTLHPLAAWRMSANLTQAELAEKAGLAESTVRDIEAGGADPRLSELKALAGALRLDIGSIID